MNHTKKLNFNICLPYSAVNSRITLKSMAFYHKTCNAAAKASEFLEGGPEVIASIIHNLLFKKTKQETEIQCFCCSTPPSIPGLH